MACILWASEKSMPSRLMNLIQRQKLFWVFFSPLKYMKITGTRLKEFHIIQKSTSILFSHKIHGVSESSMTSKLAKAKKPRMVKQALLSFISYLLTYTLSKKNIIIICPISWFSSSNDFLSCFFFLFARAGRWWLDVITKTKECPLQKYVNMI